MSNSELLKEAAAAVRELVSENEKLKENDGLYGDCLKVAFDLAKMGQIENSYEEIVGKAKELFENRDELPIVKKAMELNINYESIGDLEKTGSKDSGTKAEDLFESILMRGN